MFVVDAAVNVYVLLVAPFTAEPPLYHWYAREPPSVGAVATTENVTESPTTAVTAVG